ncbi:MAG: hypothetical protein F6K65_04000 [Moorea sp. SIO3C2]|nr:hypothetical protein [Moorena sp. SIO3C2]
MCNLQKRCSFGTGEAAPTCGGSPQDRAAVVYPTRALHQDTGITQRPWHEMK